MKKLINLTNIILVAGIIILIPSLGVNLYRSIQFDRNCTGYLKQAADASNASTASEKLDKAIKYAESNGLTHGYTSIFYTTPDDDVGYWYKNLKNTSSNLKNVDKTNGLEQSNELIKLRETLMDSGEDGENITVPNGISVHPHNLAYFVLQMTGLILALSAGSKMFLQYCSN
jgi:hypothetical protein